MEDTVGEDMAAVDLIERPLLGAGSSVDSEYYDILQPRDLIKPPFGPPYKGLSGTFDSTVELSSVSNRPESPDITVEELTVRNISATGLSLVTTSVSPWRIQSGQASSLLDGLDGFQSSKKVVSGSLFHPDFATVSGNNYCNNVKSTEVRMGGFKSLFQADKHVKMKGADGKFSFRNTVFDGSMIVNPKEASASACAVGLDSTASAEGVNLREWLKSRGQKVEKTDCTYIFKQILNYVHTCHSQGLALQNLWPSCFEISGKNRVIYLGSCVKTLESQDDHQKNGHFLDKRPAENDLHPWSGLGVKKPKHSMNSKDAGSHGKFLITPGAKVESQFRKSLNNAGYSNVEKHISPSNHIDLMCYARPEQFVGSGYTLSANVYQMGVLLFELLNYFESEKMHVTAMANLRHRILPPRFLSEYPREAGFCLWLLHPEPSCRPTTREILQSEVFGEFHDVCKEEMSPSLNQDDMDSELLLHFLHSVEDHKQKHASKLIEEIECIEADSKEVQKRHFSRISTTVKDFSSAKENWVLCEQHSKSESLTLHSPFPRPIKNMNQLENAYFSMRSKIQLHSDDATRSDNDVLRGRAEEREDREDCLGAFFDGLCKYARYSKLEARVVLRNGDFINSANVICSLTFDRDEEFFAAAGVSKKIKIFDFHSLLTRSVDIHYPLAEMVNKSKLSCVCWNSYIKNYLASSDYEGVIKLWDAGTGVGFSQYAEHQKRAWSVDFSRVDPTKLVSGSDDCSVKLWSINESKCLGTIKNIANVCCVQFSPHSGHMITFGSADYKTYCYDLRNTRIPWCVLPGHSKAVSYAKFLDSHTLVSASTDNTLKIWDLNRSSSGGLSVDACSLTLRGHTNEKNFVGLSISDGYIACGSETNEVYTYHRSMPMPITSYKFTSIDPISGKEMDDDNGQFVSSVCWGGKSDMIVAANSAGCIKVLRIV